MEFIFTGIFEFSYKSAKLVGRIAEWLCNDYKWNVDISETEEESIKPGNKTKQLQYNGTVPPKLIDCTVCPRGLDPFYMVS